MKFDKSFSFSDAAQYSPWGISIFLVKINKQISQYLTKYQYLCTHETDYEKIISTYFVEQRYNFSIGMCSQ